MNYLLMKSEPNVWSIDQQKKVGPNGAPWDGVRNYQAAKNLKNMKKGDFASLLVRRSQGNSIYLAIKIE